MGHTEHKVETRDFEFANRLYEQALDIDIEPEISTKNGLSTVEFIAAPIDALEAIEAARTGAVYA